ncbi:MAG: hypothetical protein V9E83_14675 [Baekduia sp.]
MSESPGDPRQMSEEELRNMSEEELQQLYLQQMEAEMKQIRVQDMVAQSMVSLINLGGRRAGLTPDTIEERDPEQLRIAIEAARALLPLIASELGPNAPQIEEALSQLQMAYVQLAGDAPPPAAPPSEGEGAGPAQSSGRLWVPGQ